MVNGLASHRTTRRRYELGFSPDTCSTIASKRASPTVGIVARADQGAELHECLVGNAGSGSGRCEFSGHRPCPGIECTFSRCAGVRGKTGQDAGDVPIDDRCRLTMDDRSQSPCGVATDTGQALEILERARKRSPEGLHHHFRGCMEVPGTTVVAQPLPAGDDVLLRSVCQGLDGGKALDEAQERRDHPIHLGLLEHRL